MSDSELAAGVTPVTTENLWKGWFLGVPKGPGTTPAPLGGSPGVSTRTGSTKAGYQQSSGGLASMC